MPTLFISLGNMPVWLQMSKVVCRWRTRFRSHHGSLFSQEQQEKCILVRILGSAALLSLSWPIAALCRGQLQGESQKPPSAHQTTALKHTSKRPWSRQCLPVTLQPTCIELLVAVYVKFSDDAEHEEANAALHAQAGVGHALMLCGIQCVVNKPLQHRQHAMAWPQNTLNCQIWQASLE